MGPFTLQQTFESVIRDHQLARPGYCERLEQRKKTGIPVNQGAEAIKRNPTWRHKLIEAFNFPYTKDPSTCQEIFDQHSAMPELWVSRGCVFRLSPHLG